MDWQAIIQRAIEACELIPLSAHRPDPEAIEALPEALSARGINVSET